jgi:homoserine kinase type II
MKSKERFSGEEEDVYYAIFRFLTGEDKYTWDNPLCSDSELEDSARVLAGYHDAVCDLKPEGRRYEPRIVELLPTISGSFMKYAKRTGRTKFDAYFLKHLDSILSVIDGTLAQIDRKEYDGLPHLPIHCDYHPGNLKYRGGRAVGLFDFDWSKVDSRCFDIALGITYFCSTWEGKEDGDLLLDRMAIFLKAYQDELTKQQRIGVIRNNEIAYLPVMIKASNLYVLNWDVDDYYIKKPNPFEYLIYLQHNVRLMRWLENNWDNLVYSVQRTLRAS